MFLISDSKSSAEAVPKDTGSRSMVDREGVQMRDCSWLSKPKTLTSSGTLIPRRLSPAIAPIALLNGEDVKPENEIPVLLVRRDSSR